MKSLYILLLAILIPHFSVFSQNSSEDVSEVGSILYLKEGYTIKDYIKNYVENEIDEWQKKGEFEKTEAYRQRVNEIKRKEKAKELTNEVIENIKEVYANTVSWKNITLEEYDADNETYLLIHPKFGKFALPVDISTAKSFKENFNKLKFNNAEYYFANNAFHLAKVEVTNPINNEKYHYDNNQAIKYSSKTIDYHFSDLDIKVPEREQQKTSHKTVEEKIVIGDNPIDTDIPNTSLINENTFALIIGNENYKNEIDVPYAINDAKIFKEYAVKTLGIPDKNIHLAIDITMGELIGEINWLKNTIKAWRDDAKIIFYYAGHGFPDEKSKEAHLLPIDGNSQIPETGLQLDKLFNELSIHQSKQVTIFLDACFSGASRNGRLTKGRGVVIKPKNNYLKGNMVVFSAASNQQSAYPFNDKKHGLFTYFLLKKLKLEEGKVTLGGMADFIIERVEKFSIINNNKTQTPEVNISSDIKNKWESLYLAH